MVRALEPTREFSNPDSMDSKMREYISVAQTLDSLELRRKELREEIFTYIDEEGEEDSKGNVSLDLDSPFQNVARLEKQRRVSRKLNEAVAESLIEERGLEDKVYKTIRVIDEDALMAAHYEGELSEEDIDNMFPVTITWALRTLKK